MPKNNSFKERSEAYLHVGEPFVFTELKLFNKCRHATHRRSLQTLFDCLNKRRKATKTTVALRKFGITNNNTNYSQRTKCTKANAIEQTNLPKTLVAARARATCDWQPTAGALKALWHQTTGTSSGAFCAKKTKKIEKNQYSALLKMNKVFER